MIAELLLLLRIALDAMFCGVSGIWLWYVFDEYYKIYTNGIPMRRTNVPYSTFFWCLLPLYIYGGLRYLLSVPLLSYDSYITTIIAVYYSIVFVMWGGFFWYLRRQYRIKGDLKPCDCFFCKVVSGQIPGLLECDNDNEIGVFVSTKPYGRIHVLAFPKSHHIKDVSHFNFCPKNQRLYHKMVAALKTQLTKMGKNPNAVPIYFHWPPILSIDHLHLHAVDEIFDTMQWWKEVSHRIYHTIRFAFW
jgi:diadenosine tetraphosphate (Ap4A) HIT family hydrolase